MIDTYISQLIEKVFPIISDLFDDEPDKEKIKAWYIDYIENRIRHLIENALSKPDKKTTDDMIANIFKNEVKYWSNSSKIQALNILDVDKGIEMLYLISEEILNLAIECKNSGVFLNDSIRYKQYLIDLTKALDCIKIRNSVYAKELVSNAVMDLDFAFGKSKIQSLKLGRY